MSIVVILEEPPPRFVYIDALLVWPNARSPFQKGSCHMFAASEHLDLLHDVARRLGLRREWFQRSAACDHYDLAPSRRWAALLLPEVREVSRPEAVAIWRRNRRGK